MRLEKFGVCIFILALSVGQAFSQGVAPSAQGSEMLHATEVAQHASDAEGTTDRESNSPSEDAAASAQTDAGRAGEAGSNITEQTDVIAETAPPMARIIFFRPSAFTGAIYEYHVVAVGEDGDSTPQTPRLGTLPNGGFFVHQAPPGVYYFNLRGPMAANLNEDRVRLEVLPGEIYYVQQAVRVGLVTGGFRLIPSTQQSFESRRLREWTPD
jgi:hypothetical protein